MKADRILLISGATLGAAALARYLYRNILLANEWDYTLDGFRITKLIPKVEGVVYLTFINKSNLTASIKDVDIKVFTTGNTPIGSINEPSEMKVEPNGKSRLQFVLSADPVAIAKNWRNLSASALTIKDIPLDFVGTFRLKTIFGWTKVPVRYSSTARELKSLYDEYYG